MAIYDTFSAIREGAFEEFKSFYQGDINQVEKYENLNLLCMAVVGKKNFAERLKIIKFLIDEGIDINYVVTKKTRVQGSNALHLFHHIVWEPTPSYQLEVTKLLVDNGINLNAVDKYGNIPLAYALTSNRLDFVDNVEMYRFLVEKGSDYKLKNLKGNSCLDYARMEKYDREGFLDIVKEFESKQC